MKFNYAIKILEQEKYRLIGKLAVELESNNHNVMVSTKQDKARHLNDAIEILKNAKPKRGRPNKAKG